MLRPVEVAATRRPRLSPARRVLAGIFVVLAALLLWTAWALVTSRNDLESARARLTAIGEPQRAVTVKATLRAAKQELDRADRRLSAPGPALVSRLPVVGRTPHAVRVTTTAALAAVNTAQALLSVADDGPPLVSAGQLDPAGLTRIAETLRRSGKDLKQPVEELRDVRTGLTPGIVANGVRDARGRLVALPESLDRAADAVDAIGGLLGAKGQQRLLVVLENNAELRGTGGIVSVFAEATASNGRLTLGPFRDVESVADGLGATRRVPSPADYHRLWGPYLADTTLWRNVNMSPDVATSSAVLAGVAAASLGRRPDGIIWLDVRSLAAIIGATAPARLPDGTLLTEETTVGALMSGTYRTAIDTRAGQNARRARLRAAADVVASRLLKGSPEPVALALALARAAQGRHVALWSARPEWQRAMSLADMTGEVKAGTGDIVSAVVQNFGGGDTDGNKLDFYGRRLVTVKVQLTDAEASVEQVLELRNTAPPRGLPRYVAGGATPGITNNFVTLAVPARAQLTSFTRGGDPVRTVALPEGDHLVVSDAYSVPPGASATWRLTYRLPLVDGGYVLRLVPQPVAVDGGVAVRITDAEGRRLVQGDGPTTAVSTSGPFDRVITIRVQRERPTWVRSITDSVRRFWTKPVQLPF